MSFRTKEEEIKYYQELDRLEHAGNKHCVDGSIIEAEIRETIRELNLLQSKFGYENMPMKGILTMMEYFLRERE